MGSGERRGPGGGGHLDEGGVDNARGDTVDAHVAVRPLHPQGLGDLHHGSLGGVVGDLLLRVGHEDCGHAGRVDDAATPVLQHVPAFRLQESSHSVSTFRSDFSYQLTTL